MRHDVALPRLGETVDDVRLIEWKVDMGDVVAPGDVLLVVETDKIDAEVPAPVGGTVVEKPFNPGDELTTGDIVCVLETV